MKTIPTLILAIALFITGCASTSTSTTGQAVLQIAAIELSAKLAPADRAKLVGSLSAIAVKLNGYADLGGTFTASDITAVILAHEGAVKNADIARYMREAAVLIDTQWKGVAIDPAKLRALAKVFSKTATIL